MIKIRKERREQFSKHREDVIKWINEREYFNYKDLIIYFNNDESTIRGLLYLLRQMNYIQSHAKGKYLLISKIPLDVTGRK